MYTKNIDRAMRFATGLEAGTVGVNCTSPGKQYAFNWIVRDAFADSTTLSYRRRHALRWLQVIRFRTRRRASVFLEQLSGNKERLD